MKNKTLILLTMAGLVALSFLVGYTSKPATFSAPPEKETIYLPDHGRDEKWKQVKAIDEELFLIAADTMHLCGEAVSYAGKGLWDELEANTAKTEENNDKIEEATAQRNAILTELGI